MAFGCVTARIREKLCQLGAAGLTVIVDSRDRAGLYRHVICKPNEVEAGRLFDRPIETLSQAAEGCQLLSQRTGTAAVITLGSQGSMLCANDQVFHCPACSVEPPLDFCGAGDTFLAGLAVFLAGGAAPEKAAMAANLCSAVTVKKLDTTGTASPQELLTAHKQYF
jgi:sugar/nucleoside kinase (ribokinase family)